MADSRRVFASAMLMTLCFAANAQAAQANGAHPLDALSGAEIRQVKKILTAAQLVDKATRFPMLSLLEPPKSEILSWSPGQTIARKAFAILRTDGRVQKAVIDLTDDQVESIKDVKDVQTSLLQEELEAAAAATIDDPDWQEAMSKRGFTDFSTLTCKPLTTGYFRTQDDDGKRLVRVPCYAAGSDSDFLSGRPISGLHALVDLDTMEVIQIDDTGAVPLPPLRTDQDTETDGKQAPLKPVLQVSPDGHNFKLSGKSQIRWRNWSMHARMDRRAGPILSLIRFKDGRTERSVAYKMMLSEMFVPYMDPDPNWSYRTYLDAGEIGLGYLASPLKPGVDCPKDAAFLSSVIASDQADPLEIKNAICLFERPTGGPLWRHGDPQRGAVQGRPAVEMVLRFIPTVRNYDYVVDYVFRPSGDIRVELGATGVDAVKAVRSKTMADETAEEDTRHGNLVASGTVAPFHDHFASFRIDLDVDGRANTLVRDSMSLKRLPILSQRQSIWTVSSTPIEREGALRKPEEPGSWRVINPNATTGLGHRPGYRLSVDRPIVSLLEQDDDPQKRAAFSTSSLWVTAQKDDELWAAGEFPNQSRGGGGLPAFVSERESVENADLVLWVTLGSHSITRAEDWPIIPTQWTGFTLSPFNFFDRSPAAASTPR